MQDNQLNDCSKPACRQAEWRQAACRTARMAAFQAAAADDRPLYWRLLHLSHLLSPQAVQLPEPPASLTAPQQPAGAIQ